MTGEEILYEIMTPPTGMDISYDHRLNEPDFVLHLINEYRAQFIERSFRDQGDLLGIWEQNYVVPRVDKVDTNEDVLLDLEKDFGKFSLPRRIQFPQRNEGSQNKAITHIIDGTNKSRFFPIRYEKWLSIKKSSTEMNRFNYYFVIGDLVYLTKYTKTVSVRGIFADPFKAHIIDNVIKQSGSLIIGETYIVKNGSIVHNSTTYTAPQTFVAATTTYTGTGLVYLNSNYRLLTLKDPYPFKEGHVPLIKNMIWNEFNFALRSQQDREGNASEEANISRPTADTLPSSEG
jgi:hypothetical protein